MYRIKNSLFAPMASDMSARAQIMNSLGKHAVSFKDDTDLIDSLAEHDIVPLKQPVFNRHRALVIHWCSAAPYGPSVVATRARYIQSVHLHLEAQTDLCRKTGDAYYIPKITFDEVSTLDTAMPGTNIIDVPVMIDLVTDLVSPSGKWMVSRSGGEMTVRPMAALARGFVTPYRLPKISFDDYIWSTAETSIVFASYINGAPGCAIVQKSVITSPRVKNGTSNGWATAHGVIEGDIGGIKLVTLDGVRGAVYRVLRNGSAAYYRFSNGVLLEVSSS